MTYSEFIAVVSSGRVEKLREVLGLASGFPLDPEKSVEYSFLMGAFGIEVNLQSARN